MNESIVGRITEPDIIVPDASPLNPLDGFRDRQHRFSYLIAAENVRRIRLDPSLLAVGLAHLDLRLPHHRDGDIAWRQRIEAGVEAVATALLDQSPAGDYARETAPSFGGIPASVRRDLLHTARNPIRAGHDEQ